MAKRDKDASDEKFLKDFEFVDRRTKAEVASDKQSRKDAKIKKKNDSYCARNIVSLTAESETSTVVP